MEHSTKTLRSRGQSGRSFTIVRVPGREAAGPGTLGRAAWGFPALGLGLGAGLVLTDRLLVEAAVEAGERAPGLGREIDVTSDRNYLHLAERRGLVLDADTEATWVRPASGGYEVTARQGASALPWRRWQRRYTARHVIFTEGVLGTLALLLRLKASADGLPRLSDRLGEFVRTNSEAVVGVVTPRRDRDLSRGIAIGSVLQTDPHSRLEPVRYPEGAGLFRLLGAPHVSGGSLPTRLARVAGALLRHPWRCLR